MAREWLEHSLASGLEVCSVGKMCAFFYSEMLKLLNQSLHHESHSGVWATVRIKFSSSHCKEKTKMNGKLSKVSALSVALIEHKGMSS